MASKRRLRRNQCGSKVRHASEHAAHLAIRTMRRQAGGAIGYLNAYMCPHCGGWHVGHASTGHRW